MTPPTHTYQTRISVDEKISNALTACASLLSKVQRCLFAEICAGKKSVDLKSSYLKRFGITARHFNACRVAVEGKIASFQELRSLRIHELRDKIKRIAKKKKTFQRQKKVRRLEHKLEQLETDKKEGRVRLCFGSKKLFHAQFHLEQSGYSTHEEWKKAWRDGRDNEFFLLGSKDETGGNQSCTAFIQENNKLTLRLRLPDALHVEYSKYVILKDVFFRYGHEKIIESLKNCELRKSLKEAIDPSYKWHGQAISFRLKQDEKGWRVFASTTLQEPQWQTQNHYGAIGVDINVDHLALVETDRNGNPLSRETVPVDLYGKSKKQAQAVIGEACKAVVKIA